MLDHVDGAWSAPDESSPSAPTGSGVATEDAAKRSSNTMLVWLRWNGETAAFIRAVRPSAERELFRFVDAQRMPDESGIWRCRFEEAEIAPDLEHRADALLQRLSAIGSCVRAVHIAQHSAHVEEAPDEQLWNAFARRPLP